MNYGIGGGEGAPEEVTFEQSPEGLYKEMYIRRLLRSVKNKY